VLARPQSSPTAAPNCRRIIFHARASVVIESSRFTACELRVAVERDATCTALVAQGCSQAILDALLACERAEESQQGVDDCASEARERCASDVGTSL
jgi:hypothetical protein